MDEETLAQDTDNLLTTDKDESLGTSVTEQWIEGAADKSRPTNKNEMQFVGADEEKNLDVVEEISTVGEAANVLRDKQEWEHSGKLTLWRKLK